MGLKSFDSKTLVLFVQQVLVLGQERKKMQFLIVNAYFVSALCQAQRPVLEVNYLGFPSECAPVSYVLLSLASKRGTEAQRDHVTSPRSHN